MHNRKFLYSSNIPWPPTVRSLQCVVFFYVGVWFTRNGNVLLPSFPVTNHTIRASHLASCAFKNEGNNAHLCQSRCYLWLQLASVHLHPKVIQTTGGGRCWLSNFFVCFYALFLLQLPWRLMELLQNTRVTVKSLDCSLCCWLQRVRSNETDLKSRSHKIISVFSFVCFLHLELPTTARAIFLFFFS